MASSTNNNDRTVAVTGASGFIASHIVKQLLEKGYRVRGTVRDPKDPKKVAHLTSLPGAAERLQLFKADLLDGPEAFDEVFTGAEGVFHTASPLSGKTEDEYVKPALNGTLNVLKAVEKHPEVKQVMLTSSWAALGGGKGKLPDDHVFSEKDWSNEDDQRAAKSYYSLSKTLAERAAWDFAKGKNFKLTTFNPTLVCGYMLQPTINDSVSPIAKILTGEQKTISKSGSGLIYVGDVAAAHIAAFENPESEGRHLLTSVSVPWRVVVERLREITKGKNYPIPTEMSSEGSDYKVTMFDVSKVEKLLGRKLTGLDTMLKDTVASLERQGALKSQ
eukprot:TRINITY_DN8490_c0_g1_i1.p1 TRINITY_DN8490_c0_g1~~TRINITY_DN8490_c0_g1_i1.p1  ORF type:complete len:355 (-),score=95.93 TRINITY_DN8490_c0_g1_i1:52-1047(-)